MTVETATEKGCQAEAQTVSQGLKKGVTLTEPPHPHIGVTVKEPSVETGGTAIHAPSLARMHLTLKGPSLPRMRTKRRKPDLLGIETPADENLIDLAAQAVHFETERLGSVKQAEAGILQCAKAAQAAGSVRAWQFWFEDGGWK